MRLTTLYQIIDDILTEKSFDDFAAVEVAVMGQSLVLVKGVDVIGSVTINN